MPYKPTAAQKLQSSTEPRLFIANLSSIYSSVRHPPLLILAQWIIVFKNINAPLSLPWHMSASLYQDLTASPSAINRHYSYFSCIPYVLQYLEGSVSLFFFP
jgi:hypothetical protein